MATRTRAPFRYGVLRPVDMLEAPVTTEDRQQHIAAMGQRIKGYVQFMCQVGKRNATSAEAKDRAVRIFYEQMVVLERELGRIQDDFQLE